MPKWEARVNFELVEGCLDLSKIFTELFEPGIELRIDIYYVLDEKQGGDSIGVKQRDEGNTLEVKRRIKRKGICEQWEKDTLPLEKLKEVPYTVSLKVTKERHEGSRVGLDWEQTDLEIYGKRYRSIAVEQKAETPDGMQKALKHVWKVAKLKFPKNKEWQGYPQFLRSIAPPPK